MRQSLFVSLQMHKASSPGLSVGTFYLPSVWDLNRFATEPLKLCSRQLQCYFTNSLQKSDLPCMQSIVWNIWMAASSLRGSSWLHTSLIFVLCPARSAKGWRYVTVVYMNAKKIHTYTHNLILYRVSIVKLNYLNIWDQRLTTAKTFCFSKSKLNYNTVKYKMV